MPVLRKAVRVLVALFFLTSVLGPAFGQPPIAQADGGVFPSGGYFDMMQIKYDVAGATLGTPEVAAPDPLMAGGARMHLKGQITGKILTVSGSGTRNAKNYECRTWVEVYIAKTDSFGDVIQGDNTTRGFISEPVLTGRGQSFSQSFNVSRPIEPADKNLLFNIQFHDQCMDGYGIVSLSGLLSAPVSGLTWIVVVGGIAAVAVAGTAAAAATAAAVALKRGAKSGKSSSKDKKKKQKDEPQTRYILQLSAEQVEVSPGKPATLSVTAWKVKGTAPPQPAPEAALQITVQPPNAGLQVMPSAGQGSLQAAISLGEKSSASAASLVIAANAAGASVSALVAVRITTPTFVLEVS